MTTTQNDTSDDIAEGIRYVAEMTVKSGLIVLAVVVGLGWLSDFLGLPWIAAIGNTIALFVVVAIVCLIATLIGVGITAARMEQDQ